MSDLGEPGSRRSANPSSRKALAAVCAADRAGHTAHGSSMQAASRSAKPSSRKALAAVCAADSVGHTAHGSSRPAFARWPALVAAQTAASALRLEGR